MAKSSRQKKDYYILLRLLSFLKPYKRDIIFLTICILLSAGLNTVQPLFVQKITDYGLVPKNVFIVIKYSVIILLLVILDQVIGVIQTGFYANINTKYQYTLFKTAFRKLLKFNISYFTDKNYAEITNNITMDVSNVSRITDKSTFLIVGMIFKMISGIVGLLIIDWRLTLIVVFITPIKYLFVKRLAVKRKQTMQNYLNQNREFYSWFGEIINGIKEIKLWLLQRIKTGQFVRKQKKIIETNKRLAYIDNYNQSFENIIFQTITTCLYIIGAMMIAKSSLTIGGLFAFIAYSSYVTGPIAGIINLKYNYANIVPSAKRLFGFLDLENEKSGICSFKMGEIGIRKKVKSIRFENVSFSYRTEKSVLDNLNFEISPGEKVAVTGENGAGKTTLLNLLLRFYDPKCGTIYYDGQDIQTIRLNDYRKLFSVISQDPYLFNDTIKSNVDLKKCVNDQTIFNACIKSGADQFIHMLPNQYDSIVGRNGASLSGGERQKVVVARAFVNDSPVIIFDEATSNFDAFSDAYLNSIIFSEFTEKTVIVITHKTRILEYMDRILVLKNGCITEMNRDSFYSEKAIQ